MAAGALILTASLFALRGIAGGTSTLTVYAEFLLALLIWGCIELSFLLGYVTGPRRSACPTGCSGHRHFRHAVEAIAYNEIANLAAALAIALVSRPDGSMMALSTFMLLWALRISAKLNLFFGVSNWAEGLLPERLRYLESFFRRRALNAWFPFSILLGTAAFGWLLFAWRRDQDPQDALLASLAALGVLEHGFMVMPLKSERLFTWARGASV
jgi:putative photosynthetic complex assembly protein 2